VIYTADGSKAWSYRGQWHRDGEPAIERSNGTKEWYENATMISEEDWRIHFEKKILQELIEEITSICTVRTVIPITCIALPNIKRRAHDKKIL
jgi:hypothetical protein